MKPKARVVKVGREISQPENPSFTMFTGFEFDAKGIEGVIGMECSERGEVQFVCGYTPDELRQMIRREK